MAVVPIQVGTQLKNRLKCFCARLPSWMLLFAEWGSALIVCALIGAQGGVTTALRVSF